MNLTGSNDRAVLGMSKSLQSGKKSRVSNADEKKTRLKPCHHLGKTTERKGTGM